MTLLQPLQPDPALAGSHNGGLKKTGSGDLTLAGRNTYSGPTDVYQGELIVTHNNGLADGSSLAVGNPLPSRSGCGRGRVRGGLARAGAGRAASCGGGPFDRGGIVFARLSRGRLAAIHAAARGCTTAGFVGHKS